MGNVRQAAVVMGVSMVVMVLVVMVMAVMVLVVVVMLMVVMMLMVVVMVVLVFRLLVVVVRLTGPVFRFFFHPVHLDGNVGAADAALGRSFLLYRNLGNPQAIHFLNKAVRIRQQFQKGRRQHIPGGAHAAVDIDCLHRFASIWLMRLARNPAPKPLSIFTTDTPLAQEFSMDKSADSPWKDAP